MRKEIRRVWALAIVMGVVGCSQQSSVTPDSVIEAETQSAAVAPVDYVDPYIGNISHLLVPTFPTIHLPNSMLRVIPARADFTTDKMKGLSMVTVSHRGSSAFTISPLSGESEHYAPFNHYSYDHEKVTPYSYDVFLDDANIDVSFAVSHQAGLYGITFNGEGKNRLFINNSRGEISVKDNVVSGWQVIGNEIRDFESKVYLYIETQQTPEHFGVLNDGAIIDSNAQSGTNPTAVLTFNDSTDKVKLRYGVSFISVEQAKKNLYREINHYDLDTVAKQGREVWNNTLAKINVDGGSEDDKTVFYTSLYRTYERPINLSEDGRYYSAFDGQIHDDEGVPFYTDDWIWDSYRAQHPLRVLIEKELETNIIRSFIRMSEQMDNFWFPTFPEVTGDSRRMNANHGVATVLDAYVKGLTDFDLEKAYVASRNGITEKTLAPWSGKPAGDLDEFYKTHGYFPSLRYGQDEFSDLVHGFENRQAIAVTLGTAYDEWCLSMIAGILGREDDAAYFGERAYNYRNVYNHDTHFFHPKDHDGQFIEPFDYRYSGGQGARKYYGENNGWVYRWDVPHNVADLIDLMGGAESFVNNLDATFSEPLGRSKFDFYAQLPDHTGNVGQFSMANEPSLHIPYLYNYAGQPWKTQKRIRSLIGQWFRNDLMGVPGDEDGGGMSAFVAFSQLGFYPVTPGSPAYIIGSPIFERAELDLGEGNTFVITAKQVSDQNKYIQSATLNGETWNKPWFPHSALQDGGELVLVMGPKANKAWGSDVSAAPPSANN